MNVWHYESFRQNVFPVLDFIGKIYDFHAMQVIKFNNGGIIWIMLVDNI